jgi:hypothetical protein
MNRWLLAVFACLALAAAGRAQVFFLDEFNGNALGPHWQQPPSNYWAYNVSGGQLNVTGLLYPNSPKGCCNTAAMVTTFAGPPQDFRVSTRMGWDPGVDQGISIALFGGDRHGQLAEFGYQAWGGRTPAIFAHNNRDFLMTPPPPPGMYNFTIERHGSLYQFSIDGVSIGVLTGHELELNAIVYRFWGPALAPLGAFHIDRIEVVPAPSGLAAFGVLAALGPGIRRPRRPNHGRERHRCLPSFAPHRGDI